MKRNIKKKITKTKTMATEKRKTEVERKIKIRRSDLAGKIVISITPRKKTKRKKK